MKIKRVGKNKFRKWTWVDFLKFHFYDVGNVALSIAIILLFILMIKNGVGK